MKKFKRLIISFMALVMLLGCTFGLAGCGEDIKKLELEFEVYNYEAGVMETHTFEIDMYRHLAPETVDLISKYVNEGYYDNNVVYVMSSFSKQIMFGDLVFDGDIKQNAVKPQLKNGEFTVGGTVGSNLRNAKGSVGLWRSWYAFDEMSYKSSNATDTARATCFMPTETINDYDGYFCVFAQYDVEKETNKQAISALVKAFSNADNYVNYVVYYTGEYDDSKADDNYGLTFNIMLQDDYFELEDTLGAFEADTTKAQVVQYNPTTIRIPFANNELGAKIIDAKVV